MTVRRERERGDNVLLLMTRRYLTLVGHAKIREAELLDVALKGEDLGARLFLLDEGLGRLELLACRRRDVVVHGDQCAIRASHGAAGDSKALEGLRRGDFVDEVAVDVEEPGAVLHVGSLREQTRPSFE